MKKKNLLILALAPLTVLASCGNENQSSSESAKEDTSSSSSESIDKTDKVAYSLYTFSKSVLLSGTIEQTRYVAQEQNADGSYVWSTTAETNEYYTSVGFESDGRNAIYKRSTQDVQGEETTMENYTYFEDEDGYAYKESLNYKNEVERDYSINLTTSSFAANGFYNPFTVLSKDDFTLKDGKYNLDLAKTEIITNNLLYSLNSGFASSVKEAYFTAEGDLFNTFSVTMDDFIYYDSSYGYVYKIVNTVDFIISRGGTYKVPSVSSYSSKDNKDLSAALKKLSSNYTLSVQMNTLNQLTEKESTTYQDFYFTGDEIYVHSYTDSKKQDPDKTTDFYLSANEDGTLHSYVYNAENDAWEKGNATGFPSLYQDKNTYNDYFPKAGQVSSDLFKYDSENNSYVAEDDAISSLINCFYPNVAPFRKSASNSFQDAEIILDGENVSYINLPFAYSQFDADEVTILSGNYVLSYSNIGTTTNPAK